VANLAQLQRELEGHRDDFYASNRVAGFLRDSGALAAGKAAAKTLLSAAATGGAARLAARSGMRNIAVAHALVSVGWGGAARRARAGVRRRAGRALAIAAPPANDNRAPAAPPLPLGTSGRRGRRLRPGLAPPAPRFID
jgi:hypothetical protein